MSFWAVRNGSVGADLLIKEATQPGHSEGMRNKETGMGV